MPKEKIIRDIEEVGSLAALYALPTGTVLHEDGLGSGSRRLGMEVTITSGLPATWEKKVLSIPYYFITDEAVPRVTTVAEKLALLANNQYWQKATGGDSTLSFSGVLDAALRIELHPETKKVLILGLDFNAYINPSAYTVDLISTPKTLTFNSLANVGDNVWGEVLLSGIAANENKTAAATKYSELTNVPTGSFLVPDAAFLLTGLVAGQTYVLSHAIDLAGATITLPRNATLQFTSGRILNGTLNATAGLIVADRRNIFSAVTLTGTWRMATIFPEWWGDLSNSSYDWQAALQAALDVSALSGGEVKLAAYTYRFNGGMTMKAGTSMRGIGRGETVLGSGATKGSVLWCTGMNGNAKNVALKVTGSMVNLGDFYLRGMGQTADTTTGLQLYGVGVGIENCAFENIIVHSFLGGIGWHIVAGNAGAVTYCMFNNMRMRNCKHHHKIESLSSNPIYGNVDANGAAYTQSTGFLNSNTYAGFYSSGYADSSLWVRSEIDTVQVNSQDVYRPCNNLIFTGVIIEPPYSSLGHIRIEGNGSQLRMHDIRVEASQQNAYYPNTPVIFLGPTTNGNLINCDQIACTLTDQGYNNRIEARTTKVAPPAPDSANLFKNSGFAGLRAADNGGVQVIVLAAWTIEEQCVDGANTFAWRQLRADSVVKLEYDSVRYTEGYRVLKLTVPPKYQFRMTQNLNAIDHNLVQLRVGAIVKANALSDITFTYQDNFTPINATGASFGTGKWESIGGAFPIRQDTSYYRLALFVQNIQNPGGTNIVTSITHPTMVRGEITPIEPAQPITDLGGTVYGVLGYNLVRDINPTVNPTLLENGLVGQLLLPREGNYYEYTDQAAITRINYVQKRFPAGALITLLFRQKGVGITSSSFIALKQAFVSDAGSTITLLSKDGNGVWEEISRSMLTRGRGLQSVDLASAALSGGILTVSDIGENVFTLSNSSTTSASVSRINQIVGRMEAGSRVVLEFTNMVGAVNLVNNAYIILSKYGNYNPLEGDWIELYTRGDGVWREVDRKPVLAPAASKGHLAIEASTLVSAGILTLPLTGENSFKLSNTSAGGVTISRINDVAKRMDGGSLLLLNFGTLTNTIQLTNNAYLSLAKTGNFTPLSGDWILLSTEGDGVWRELHRKPSPAPYVTSGLKTLVYASVVAAGGFLTVPITGENYFKLDASASGGVINRINDAGVNRLPAGTVLTLKFINVTSPVTLANSGYILLAGAVNFVPPLNSLLTLITSGDGTWEELSRRTS